MAKQHSSLTGVDLHDPKGIGAKNSTKVLHISQSVNKIDVSGSIVPTDNNAFQLGQSDKIFSRIHTNQITASSHISGSSISTASFGRYEGDGSGLQNVTANSVTFANVSGKPTLFSGSAQIDPAEALLTSNVISGSSIASSAQGEVALTTNGVAASAVDLGLQVSDSPTFAGLTIQGKLTAETYAVSSSVTHMTRSFSSGSTIFGDTLDDSHQFTGSLFVTGSVTALEYNGIFNGGVISGSEQLPSGIISGSEQLPSGVISGSVQVVSSLPNGTISGSGQLPNGIISGSTQLSQGFGNISGSVTSTGSFGSAKLDGNFTLGGGYISVNNKGVQSQLRLYCEVNNAHYVALQAPPHAEFGGNVTITLPPTTDTLVGRTTTDTLTNKTLTSPDINGGTIDDISRVSGSSVSTGSLGSLIVDGASIDFSNVPTSDPNIAGRVFRSGTDLKISTGGV